MSRISHPRWAGESLVQDLSSKEILRLWASWLALLLLTPPPLDDQNWHQGYELWAGLKIDVQIEASTKRQPNGLHRWLW